ncbi:hypothetical protein H6G33_34425 [Calothrix sp. FACHB-1219]|uniref:hypothetical protein n=1 Tax=unclassified Calothrix TaxID=2619626 RepID=UPI001686A600|nr:hypothetical protein [Calothrix sp. FACHB-1219]MBD2222040.1 hypothetical protein [Calothrix sp. FACHB-1219]
MSNSKPDKIKSEKIECLISQGESGSKQEAKSYLNERGSLPEAKPAANKKVKVSLRVEWELDM